MYECMNVSMFAYMFACMCLYVCMYACMHACMHICMHIFVYANPHPCAVSASSADLAGGEFALIPKLLLGVSTGPTVRLNCRSTRLCMVT